MSLPETMAYIRLDGFGGPEVLKLEDLPMPAPGPGEALVRIQAIGVNFVEIYHRIGLYKLALPFTPGTEAAGVVEAVGANVTAVVQHRLRRSLRRQHHRRRLNAVAAPPGDRLEPSLGCHLQVSLGALVPERQPRHGRDLASVRRLPAVLRCGRDGWRPGQLPDERVAGQRGP